MIPDGLDFAAGFMLGAFVFFAGGIALGGMLAALGRDDAEVVAFHAGMMHERKLRVRAPGTLRPDLLGDESTELGRMAEA